MCVNGNFSLINWSVFEYSSFALFRKTFIACYILIVRVVICVRFEMRGFFFSPVNGNSETLYSPLRYIIVCLRACFS